MAGPSAPEAARVSVRVLPKTSDFRPALRKFLEKVAAQELLTIRTEADTDGLARDVRRAVDYAQKQAPPLEFGPDVDPRDLVRETRQAAAIAEKSAKISLPIDVGKLAALGGILGSIGKGAVGLAGAISAVGTLAALGKALAPAVGALAAIPALAVGGAAAALTLKLGLSGVGDALAGDAEALAKLAPAARGFVSTVAGLRGGFDSLKQSVQGNLFDGLGASLAQVADVWLPKLATRLPAIADGFNAIGKAAADGATSQGFTAGIDAALDHTGQGLTSLAGAVAPIMDALGRVVGAFSGALSGAGVAAAGLAEKFAAFIERADETGQLAEFVTTVGSTLSTLGSVLLNVGGILHAITGAATSDGAGMLGVINQVTGAVSEFLNSAEGQDALSSLFESAHALIGALLPTVTTLAAGIGSQLAPALASIAVAAGPALEVLGGALVEGVSALAPHVGPLASSLAGIVTAAAPLLPIIGQLAGVFAQFATGALSNVSAALQPLSEALTSAFSPEFMATLAASFTSWVEAARPMAEQYGPLLAQAATSLLGPLLELVPVLLDSLLPAMMAWMGAQMSILEAVLPLLPPLLGLVAALAPLVALAAQLAAWLINLAMKAVRPLLDLLVVLTTWLAEGLTVAIRETGEWLGSLGGWFSALGDDIGDAVGRAVAFWSEAFGFFRRLPGKVIGFLDSLPGRLVDLGEDMVSGVLRGLSNMGGQIRDLLLGFANDAWSAVTDFFGISSPSKLFAWLGEQIGAGWVRGLEGVRAPVVRSSLTLATAAYEPWRPRALDVAPATPAPTGTGAVAVSVRVGERELRDIVVDAIRDRAEDVAATVRHGNRLATVRG